MNPRPLGALLTAGTIAWLTSWSPAAEACSCMRPPPPTEALAEVDAVFEARAAGVRAGQPAGSGQVTVTLDVLRAWKGVEVPQVTVTTSASSAACGFNFEEGKSYLLYARTVDGALSVGLCSRSQAIEEAGDDLAALGEAKFVPGDTPTPSPAPTGTAPAAPGEPPPPPAVGPPPPPPEPAAGGCAGCATAALVSSGSSVSSGESAFSAESGHGWTALFLAAGVAFARRRRGSSAV